jgi:large subunit ribosomal protein L7Ae
MAKAIYVRFEMPNDLVEKVYQLVELSSDTGRVARGTNEVTKKVERGEAALVIMAEDVAPPEIVAHLPILCEEKNIAFAYVPSKQELGVVSGLKKPTASVAVQDAGTAKAMLSEIVDAVNKLRK